MVELTWREVNLIDSHTARAELLKASVPPDKGVPVSSEHGIMGLQF